MIERCSRSCQSGVRGCRYRATVRLWLWAVGAINMHATPSDRCGGKPETTEDIRFLFFIIEIQLLGCCMIWYNHFILDL